MISNLALMYGNMGQVFSYLPDTSLEYLIGVLMESIVLILPGETYPFYFLIKLVPKIYPLALGYYR